MSRIFEPINHFNQLMTYNWQLSTWANFVYDEAKIASSLPLFALALGEVKGLQDSLSPVIKQEIAFQFMINKNSDLLHVNRSFYFY